MASNSSDRRRSKSPSRRTTKLPQSQSQHPQRLPNRHRVKQIERSVSLSIQMIRLIICGLGASAIAGTTISIVNPPKQQSATKLDPPFPQSKSPEIERLNPGKISTELTKQLLAKIQKNARLDASYLFIDIDSGEYSELRADLVLPAASTIKLPILIALFQDVDARTVQLTEQLTLDKQSIVGGAGNLQALPPGTQVSILDAATKMMTISDNTATNLLIKRLGGATVLNQRFRKWGLNTTAINRPLPDLEGKNVTTARELTRLMLAITDRLGLPDFARRTLRERGDNKIVSDASRSQILEMMSKTHRNTMLPKGLGAGAKIAHKTGDIGSIIADVGTIELPSGKKYLATAIVKRPYNDPAGPELIRQMSKVAYDYFQAPPPASLGTTFQPKVDSGFPNTTFINKP